MTSSLMRSETAETPEALARFLERSRNAVEEAGAALRKLDPPVVVTVARGSSDHAAHFFKYCAELTCGAPVASVGPSIASVYERELRLSGGAALAISQSGQSPDIVALQKSLRSGGGRTVAIVNDAGSPLAAESDHVIDIHAGLERSVAATKTFVLSAAACLALIAAWAEDERLSDALRALPEHLETALTMDWQAAAETICNAHSLYVIGRGPGYAIAEEAALKFKETATLHAEAYSGAEVKHGPFALLSKDFPVLVLTADDMIAERHQDLVRDMRATGSTVYAATTTPTAGNWLQCVATGHPLTAPLGVIVSFYCFVEAIARRRGLDPDRPRNLKKVTETR